MNMNAAQNRVPRNAMISPEVPNAFIGQNVNALAKQAQGRWQGTLPMEMNTVADANGLFPDTYMTDARLNQAVNDTNVQNENAPSGLTLFSPKNMMFDSIPEL